MQTARIEDQAEYITQTMIAAETSGTKPLAKQQSQGPGERQSTITEIAERRLAANASNTAKDARELHATTPRTSERHQMGTTNTHDAAVSAVNEVAEADARTLLQKL